MKKKYKKKCFDVFPEVLIIIFVFLMRLDIFQVIT